MKANSKPRPSESCLNRFYSWLFRNLNWLIPTIVSCVLGWMQFYQYVEADLIVTGVRVASDDPQKRVYEIDFVVNNSGNQTVTVINAVPYISPISTDLNLSNKLLLDSSNNLEKILDSSVKGGEIKVFSVHAFVDKQFISDGAKDQDFFSKESKKLTDGKELVVSMDIKLDVLIYSTDKKYRTATSPKLMIIYSQGQQRLYKRQFDSVSFKEDDINDSKAHIFEEPLR